MAEINYSYNRGNVLYMKKTHIYTEVLRININITIFVQINCKLKRM